MKTRLLVSAVLSISVVAASCSSDPKTTSKTTAGGSTTTSDPGATGGSTVIVATPTTGSFLAVPDTAVTTTIPQSVITTTTSSGTPTTISATTKDWEVVVGIYATKAEATAQITKLTAAKFTGFTTKTTSSGKTAVIKLGYTNAGATAYAAKINKAGTGKATIFHVTTSSSGTTATTTAGSATTTTVASATAKTWEVVEGVYTTKALATAEITKLTKAGFAGFTVKAVLPSYAVVLAGLTNAKATDLASKVTKAGFGPARTKNLG